MALVVYEGDKKDSFNVMDSDDSTDVTAAASDEKKGSHVGLKNQGATCYLNGVIQTLFMTPEFRHAIFSWRYDPTKHKDKAKSIPYQLQRLFGLLQLGKVKFVDTVGLTTSFGWTSVEAFQQQDVQELLRVLFDALEQTFKGTELEKVIDQIYAGQLIDYIRCIDINYQSERTDKFLDFSLTIIPFGQTKALSTVPQCIDAFLTPEILDGENQYFAESVGKKVDAIKGIKFGSLPHIMTIQLKRFVSDFSGYNVTMKKINDVVKFPMVLDMNKYVALRTNAADGAQVPNEEFEAYLMKQIAELRDKKRSSADGTVEEENEDSEGNTKGKPSSELEEATTEVDCSTMPDLVDNDGKLAPDQQRENDPLAIPAEVRFANKSATRDELYELVQARGEWIYELYAILIHSGAISGGHYYSYIKDLDTLQWWNFNDANVTAITEEEVLEAWGKEMPAYNYSYKTVGTGWGTSSYNYNSGYNYNSPTSYTSKPTFSGANAYMLMYRKVIVPAGDGGSPSTPLLAGATSPRSRTSSASVAAGDNNASLLGATNSSSNDAGDSVYPLPNAIPDYIHELIREEESRILKQKQEEEERRNALKVTIRYQSREEIFSVKQTDSLESLLVNVWTHFQLETTPLLSDLAPVVTCNFDRFRLRLFNTRSNLLEDIYDHASNGASSLQLLRITQYGTYAVELLAAGTEWTMYYPNGVNCMVHPFSNVQQKYLPSKQLSLSHTGTVEELQQFALAWFQQHPECFTRPQRSLDISRVRCYYFCKGTYHYASKIQDLDYGFYQLKKHFNILSNDNLYVEYIESSEEEEGDAEEKNDGNTVDPVETAEGTTTIVSAISPTVTTVMTPKDMPPGRMTLEKLLYSVTIHYNKPPSLDMTEPLQVDLRISADALYQVMCDTLKADPELSFPDLTTEQIKLKLYYKEGRDLFGKSTLKTEGFNDFTKLFVSVGRHAPPNTFFIIFKQFTPRHPVSKEPISNKVVILAKDTLRSDSDNDKGKAPNSASDVGLEDVLIDHVSEVPSAIPIDESDPLGDTKGPAIELEAATAVATAAIATATDAVVCVDPTVVDVAATAVQVDAEIALTSTKLVEPNDFGQAVVSAILDPASSEIIKELENVMYAGDSTNIAEFRQRLLEELKRIGRVPETTTAQHIRLRPCVYHDSYPDKIIRDGRTPREQGLFFSSQSRTLYVQILNDDELDEHSLFDALSMSYAYNSYSYSKDINVLTQRWHRQTWSMGEMREFIISSELTLSEIFGQLAIHHGIPTKNLRVLVLRTNARAQLSDLSKDQPTYYRRWMSYANEHRRLVDIIYVDDKLTKGDLILAMDFTEPLKELTPEDLRSLEIVKAASRPTYSSYGGYYDDDYQSTTYSVSKPTAAAGVRRGAGGIKIKVQSNDDSEQQPPQEADNNIIESTASSAVLSGAAVHPAPGSLFEDVDD